MKHRSFLRRSLVAVAVGAALLTLARSLWAQPSANDLIVEHFFPPELLAQARPFITLTQEQETYVRTQHQKTLDHVAALQARIRKEAEALVPLVTRESVDEQQVLAQSEKIRDLESEIKRAHFALLIRVKNKLTPEQQRILKGLQARNAVIQDKLLKTQELARQRQQEGRNLTVLEPLRSEFESLMRQGKLQEAEKVLDRTLGVLESLK